MGCQNSKDRTLEGHHTAAAGAVSAATTEIVISASPSTSSADNSHLNLPSTNSISTPVAATTGTTAVNSSASDNHNHRRPIRILVGGDTADESQALLGLLMLGLAQPLPPLAQQKPQMWCHAVRVQAVHDMRTILRRTMKKKNEKDPLMTNPTRQPSASSGKNIRIQEDGILEATLLIAPTQESAIPEATATVATTPTSFTSSFSCSGSPSSSVSTVIPTPSPSRLYDTLNTFGQLHSQWSEYYHQPQSLQHSADAAARHAYEWLMHELLLNDDRDDINVSWKNYNGNDDDDAQRLFRRLWRAMDTLWHSDFLKEQSKSDNPASKDDGDGSNDADCYYFMNHLRRIAVPDYAVTASDLEHVMGVVGRRNTECCGSNSYNKNLREEYGPSLLNHISDDADESTTSIIATKGGIKAEVVGTYELDGWLYEVSSDAAIHISGKHPGNKDRNTPSQAVVAAAATASHSPPHILLWAVSLSSFIQRLNCPSTMATTIMSSIETTLQQHRSLHRQAEAVLHYECLATVVILTRQRRQLLTQEIKHRKGNNGEFNGEGDEDPNGDVYGDEEGHRQAALDRFADDLKRFLVARGHSRLQHASIAVHVLNLTDDDDDGEISALEIMRTVTKILLQLPPVSAINTRENDEARVDMVDIGELKPKRTESSASQLVRQNSLESTYSSYEWIAL